MPDSFEPDSFTPDQGPLTPPPVEEGQRTLFPLPKFLSQFARPVSAQPKIDPSTFFSPKTVTQRVSESAPVDIAASVAMPTKVPFLARLGEQGGLQGLRSAGRGEDLGSMAWNALLGAGGQAVGEAAALPFRVGGSITQGVKQGREYVQAVKDYAEQQASKFTDYLQKEVPALKGLETGAKGLWSMLYGRGRDLVKQHYADYLVSAKDATSGLKTSFPLEDLATLKVKPLTTNVQMGTGEAMVPDVIEAVTGKSKVSPDTFRRVVGQLDALDVLDPAERQAYKTYEGMRESVDLAKALKRKRGIAQFQPEKIEDALSNWKKLSASWGRGLGSGETGILSEMNLNPPTPPNIAQASMSPFSLYHAGRALAGPLGGAAGLVGGSAAAKAGPVPFARNTEAMNELLTRLPAGLAALVRQYLSQ